MTRRWIALFVALGLALSLSGPVAGKGVGGTEGGCDAGSFLSTISLFGEDNLRGADNTDPHNGVFVCGGTNVPDLTVITQDANDDCKGFLGLDDGDFNDCASSLQVDIAAFFPAVCVYSNTNYSGNKRKYNTDTIDNSLDFTFDDAIGSIKWVGVTQAC